jgi:hypothetical protein
MPALGISMCRVDMKTLLLPRRRHHPRGLITGEEACRMLGVTPRRLYDLMRYGVLSDRVLCGWKPWLRRKDVQRLAARYLCSGTVRRVRGLDVDDQFVFGRLLDRQVGRSP